MKYIYYFYGWIFCLIMSFLTLGFAIAFYNGYFSSLIYSILYFSWFYLAGVWFYNYKLKKDKDLGDF